MKITICLRYANFTLMCKCNNEIKLYGILELYFNFYANIYEIIVENVTD